MWGIRRKSNGWIYITSKVHHAKIWQAYEKAGWPLSCSWIWMKLNPKNKRQMARAWIKMISDCRRTRVLIVYLEEGEQLKGGLAEIGAVLASGGKIFSVGFMPCLDEGNRDFSQAITQFPDMDSALAAALEACKP